ncbi:MAG: hypothetical protein IJF94_03885 [Eubacterium sp.]|nr:hypothetical protein [Eubacterium sp.]
MMIKVLKQCVIFVLIIMFLVGCGCKGKYEQEDNKIIDLTKMSSTMVYSQVYSMVTSPEDFDGKEVIMEGNITSFKFDEKDKLRHACVVQDATACCEQGIEFELKNDAKTIKNYPDEGAKIKVVGIFKPYKRDKKVFCRLVNAHMTKID